MRSMSMSKTVVLAGHCGPDSSYLKLTIKKAIADANIVFVDDSRELSAALEKSEPDLVLFNRELGYGFDHSSGVEMISTLHRTNPNLKMILVSNFPEAQAAAEAAGALPGFGKRELGTSRVHQVLREALGVEVIK
jgi:two-component system chemotaxis response regulator CheY